MRLKKVEDLSELAVIGVDIGKDVFHLMGIDDDGNLVLRRKIKRLALTATFEKLPRCVVGLEACLSAHCVSRTLGKLGFPIPPAGFSQRGRRAATIHRPGR